MDARAGENEIVVFEYLVTVVDKGGFEAVCSAVDVLDGYPEATAKIGPPIRFFVDHGESLFDGGLRVEAGRGQIV